MIQKCRQNRFTLLMIVLLAQILLVPAIVAYADMPLATPAGLSLMIGAVMFAARIDLSKKLFLFHKLKPCKITQGYRKRCMDKAPIVYPAKCPLLFCAQDFSDVPRRKL